MRKVLSLLAMLMCSLQFSFAFDTNTNLVYNSKKMKPDISNMLVKVSLFALPMVLWKHGVSQDLNMINHMMA
jgi:hypothetical protein